MALFEPVTLGDVAAENRIFLAPLTRVRATMPGHIPNDLMANYYAQRASAGLIIAEATMVAENTSSFFSEPGLYNAEQVEGWKKTTSAVHAKGGKIFVQIWHGGRAAPPENNNGTEAVSSGNLKVEGHKIDQNHNATGQRIDYPTPRALTDEEIPEIVEKFRYSAELAIEAGFDGVEIHGANGYLIDQFLKPSANNRTGPYGGPIENRARFLFEILTAVTKQIGGGRVGLRLSPLNSYNGMSDPNPIESLTYLAKKLNDFNLAYLHVMRADFFGVQKGDVTTPVREHFKGKLVLNIGYTKEEAEKVIADGQADAIAFGVPFLANPDLPERFRVGAPLNAPRPELFYTQGAAGYDDYPFLEHHSA